MKRARKPPKKAKSQKAPDRRFLAVWMMVDGAVRDCFIHHPEYINRKYDEPAVRLSIVKRVTGQIYGLVRKHEGARSA
jgi:hypothetical protein